MQTKKKIRLVRIIIATFRLVFNINPFINSQIFVPAQNLPLNLRCDGSKDLFKELGVAYGGRVEIAIINDTRKVYRNIIKFARSFADVNVGEPLVYVNSLDYIAVAINQGSFSKAYNISTGSSWKISIRKAPKVIYE